MATLYQTTGIILSRRDRREADRWYSAYTRDCGKIEFLARGAHKPLAKLTSHLELAGEVDLLMVNGRYYETVAGASRTRAFSNIHTDVTRLLLAHNALHLMDIGTRAHEQDVALYDLLLDWLTFLDTISPFSKGGQRGGSEALLGVAVSPERAAYLLGSFTLKLLSLTGYHPELSRCLSCKSALEPAQHHWHSQKGGVVCRTCVQNNHEEWFAARTLRDETLKLLRFALSAPFADQLRPHLAGETILEFHEALESLIVCHFPTIPANSIRAACLAS